MWDIMGVSSFRGNTDLIDFNCNQCFCQVCHQLVQSARRLLERQLSGVPIEVNEVRETPQTAFGNSSGIM